jgi:hypothetical protein
MRNPGHFSRLRRRAVPGRFTLKKAVNAKTPRGQGARNREIAREKQV